MLTYQHEGFLLVEDDAVLSLQRSSLAVSFQLPSKETLEVQAFLVTHRCDDERQDHAAFYCRNLKRSLIFAVDVPASQDLPGHGAAELRRLGFELVPVNINLSPALRQVVLRDVPPLRRPSPGDRSQTKSAPLSAETESVMASIGDSDSAIAKSAALRLNAQRDLQKKMGMLRKVLEQALLGTLEDESQLPAPAGEDATGEATEAHREAERRLAEEVSIRKHAEAFLEAAELRIRELEEQLVEVETQSAETVKLRKKIVDLEKLGKELGKELAAAAVRFDAEVRQREKLDRELVTCRERLGECESRLASGAEQAATHSELEQRCQAEVARAAALDVELSGVRERMSSLLTTRDDLLEELKDARGRIETLVQERDASGKQASALAASEKRVAAMDKRAAGLEKALAKMTDERDYERDQGKKLQATGKKLQKELTALQKRVDTQENHLVEARQALVEARAADAVIVADDEVHAEAPLQNELAGMQAVLEAEREERTRLEEQLDGAHRMLASLEQALKAAKGARPDAAAGAVDDSGRVQELTAQLRALEALREREELDNRKAAKVHADAEKRIAELELALQDRQSQPAPAPVVGSSPAAKTLPHELRPAPKPGALLRPDWDLHGLPCRSAEQVLQAWESLSNVQLSLEGYPSQYCAAFLVVLKQDRHKRLYCLFSLKKDKHILVCVPSQLPGDDAALRKAIDEVLKYLRKSGFELEPIAAKNVAATLGSHFLAV